MAKEDSGFRGLLAEIAQLIAGALAEKMENEELQSKIINISGRMEREYGRTIGTIILALEFLTLPAPDKKRKGKNPELSLNFKVDSGGEDKEFTKRMRVRLDKGDANEMNRILEQARREREKEGGEDNDVKEAAKSPNPRNVSQIMNSIRETARALNLNQRRLLVEKIRDESRALKHFFASIETEEQMKNDTNWLRCLQNLFNEMQKKSQKVQDGGRWFKETLLMLEIMFKDLRTF